MLTIGAAPAVAAALTGAFLGAGLGSLIIQGRIWPIFSLVPLGVGVWVCLRALVPSADRRRIGAVVAFGAAVHIALAVFIFTTSLAAGRGGFGPGDDAEYANLARNFVAYLRGELDPALGPPWWGGELYLFRASGTWVYLESAIFYLIGPEVIVPVFLNGAFALITALLMYDMVRRLFGGRGAVVALVLGTFFPSLLVWTSLNLKESLALVLIALCIWSLMRFHERPRSWPLTLAFAAVAPIETLRGYLFIGLAALIPLVVAISPRLPLRARASWTVASVVVSVIFIGASQNGIGLGPQLLQSFVAVREGMAVGARTAYVAPPPVAVHEGDTFVVPTVAPAAVPTRGPLAATTSAPVATEPPSVVHVALDTRIVIVTGPPVAPPSPGVVFVRPGDVVVVGGPERTPAATEARRELVAPTPAPNVAVSTVAFTPDRSGPDANTDTLVRRTVQDLPIGLAYALFAPFPWSLERRLDFALLPEMLLWYVCIVAAAATAIRERRSWQTVAPLTLLSAGLLGLFALVEGNWGTLFRHRAMVIPWVLTLAAPSLWMAFAAVAMRRSPRVRSITHPRISSGRTGIG
jgi:hypothetical protein